MKLGIKKIEYIPVTKVHSWAHVGRNDSINVNAFIDSEYIELEFAPFIGDAFKELKFTHLTASLEEEWVQERAGVISSVSASGAIRANKEQIRKVLAALIVQKNIFRITAINGDKYLIGSVYFTPRVLFNLTISDITTSEYQFTITCKSTHGLVIDRS